METKSKRPTTFFPRNDESGSQLARSLKPSDAASATSTPTVPPIKPHLKPASKRKFDRQPFPAPLKLPLNFSYTRGSATNETSPKRRRTNLSCKEGEPWTHYAVILSLNQAGSGTLAYPKDDPGQQVFVLKRSKGGFDIQITLPSHRNIVSLFEVFVTNGFSYFISESMDISLTDLQAAPIRLEECHIAALSNIGPCLLDTTHDEVADKLGLARVIYSLLDLRASLEDPEGLTLTNGEWSRDAQNFLNSTQAASFEDLYQDVY
ncbi:MAG: hypothetical protein M1833_004263 [Piccolia ochrophora]|nr:MAG: hypothetical protein M1833_004263 [Piccolia ochrophora]